MASGHDDAALIANLFNPPVLLSMLTLTVIVVGVLFVAGVIAILHAAKHAPEGYEDELGFHPRVRKVPVVVTSESSDHGWAHNPLARHSTTHAPHFPAGAC